MPNRTAPPQTATTTAPAATTRQIDYINALIAQREMDDTGRDFIKRSLAEGMTKNRASEIIGRLVALPMASIERAAEVRDVTSPKVPAGNYALAHPDDALNPIRFYAVQDGKDSRDSGGKDWRGKQFVKRYASDERYPVTGVERYRVLTTIASNPLEAAKLYGTETGQCCRCNRKLTRETSRALGYGPECAQYMEG